MKHFNPVFYCNEKKMSICNDMQDLKIIMITLGS